MSDKHAAHTPTAAEIQARAEHDAEVRVEAKHLIGQALNGDVKAFHEELAGMSPNEQREVLGKAKEIEKDREVGHVNDSKFPKIVFWDSQSPDANPKVDLTAQGSHHDKIKHIYDSEDPRATKTAAEKAGGAAQAGASAVAKGFHGLLHHN